MISDDEASLYCLVVSRAIWGRFGAASYGKWKLRYPWKWKRKKIEPMKMIWQIAQVVCVHDLYVNSETIMTGLNLWPPPLRNNNDPSRTFFKVEFFEFLPASMKEALAILVAKIVSFFLLILENQGVTTYIGLALVDDISWIIPSIIWRPQWPGNSCILPMLPGAKWENTSCT